MAGIALGLFDGPFLAQTQGGGSFDPDSIAGLYTWLESSLGILDDSDNPITVDGTAVKTWQSQKAGGIDVSQGTAAFRPLWQENELNGRPLIQFDGANDFLPGTGAGKVQPQTLLFVIRLNTLGAYHPIFDGQLANRFLFAEYPANSWDMWVNSGADINIGAANTNWNIVTLIYNGAASKYAFNTKTLTTVSGSPGTNDIGGLTLAADHAGGNNAQVDFAELLWYEGALAQPDIDSILDYLSAKYALALV